ncbi:MAG: polyribonucleotide nucleotidyltransferase [Planctomycetota bacterium]|nr:polyribonucleotide nucleotidyltransferase [Planctomycetota bacterium]
MMFTVEKDIAGRRLVIETGKVARQANGAVFVRYGETQIFAAATGAELKRELDFFPLTVDYREKTAAAGKFPGGFIKREGRPTTKEILTCRLIDRPIRPLFPAEYQWDTSIQSSVFSADQQNNPDVLAVIGASAALTVSDLPFRGPLGCVRMGLVGGELVIFPTEDELADSDMDLVVAGTREAVTMVEGGANEVSEQRMLEAIERAHQVVREIVELQAELAAKCGKPKLEFEPLPDHSELRNELRERYYSRIAPALRTTGKMARKLAFKELLNEAVEQVCPKVEAPEQPRPDAPEPKLVAEIMEDFSSEVERNMILEGTRIDGRAHTDIRDISIEVGNLPKVVHGSALFTRGETQAAVTITLGTKRDQQIVDGLSEEYRERFMLHYNFPSFCVGETWPNRGPKRREIGHGALASRALQAVIPHEDKFPYTIRAISDIMESNGSSSMASVCGGTMALMDGGVKIRQPVAGIAMGLIKDGERVAILSDILGSEDHNGDMDFKVAGTQFGITALQMDIKITGISSALMQRALEQAKEGRIHILREMLKALKEPRPDISPYAPRCVAFHIDPEKIGLVIGPGGKMIKKIQEDTDSTIEIEDDGRVLIWASTMAFAQDAQQRIEALTEEIKSGRIYNGRVVSIKEFGCFVEVLPGQEGLVHVSELAQGFVRSVEDVVSIGDVIPVKCLGTDNQGRVKLSKSAAEQELGIEPAPVPAGSDSGGPDAGGGGPPRRGGEGGGPGGGRSGPPGPRRRGRR